MGLWILKKGLFEAISNIRDGINKNLLFDLSRIWRWSAVILSADVHTCYDNMKHTMASWCFQRWVDTDEN